ncbi:hypothetical protein SAMN05443668_103437 [Cryptosporangium aurantiacum]|uniref:Substrate-binding protein-like domain-containing protein n=2 Tax=Cryptosporangium aurantiacum TaxID=134849 RepID=A0A1M7PK26_9ACTN|nr:hypothetical protein SAMN05443668_103437 [Cryptosporangium aurantiacum]
MLCRIGHPPLTALSRNVAAYGAKAARHLLELVTTGATVSEQDTATLLVPRGSTATLRTGPASSTGSHREPRQ